MKGTFITFEGVEGSGKSTQVGMLSSALKEKGKEIVVAREPGGTGIGEQIREITHSRENVDLTGSAELYLMAASRAQLVREIISPALEKGKIVIADRFIDSSLAYQGYGRGFGEKTVRSLNKLALGNVFPDLTIFLDLEPEVGFARRNGSGKRDRLDLQTKDFYEKVYRGYKELAILDKKRYFKVDGKLPIEKVRELIWERVIQLLGND